MIRDAAAGDADARSAFATQYLPAVRAYLAARWRTCRLADEAEDAAQEVFIEFFRDAGALDRADPERGGFRGFLFGVTRNVALRFEKRGARRAGRELQPGSDALEQVVADADGPSQVFDRGWATALMRQAGSVMKRRARASDDGALQRVELLRLRIVDALPIREIARRWDADPQQVHRAYARARREFHTALREVVSGLHAGPSEAIEAECERLLALFS